jgi:hypothetical protein
MESARHAIGRLERLWALISSAAFLLLASLMYVRYNFYGMGVALDNGLFILKKGINSSAIEQAIGFRIYVLQWAVVVFGIATVILSACVLMRHKETNLLIILPGKEGRALRLCVMITFALVAVVAVITGIR